MVATMMITSAVGAAICLALGLALRSSRRASAADRHEGMTVAVALALVMPLLVAAMPASMRLDLAARLTPPTLLEETVAHGTLAPTTTTIAPETRHLEHSAAPVIAGADGRTHARTWGAAAIALGVWAAGTLFFALRLARAGWIAAGVRRRARGWGDDDVAVSSEVSVPMVTGVLSPSIILPEDAPRWTAEELALTLLHERAHIARRDVAKQWAASIVCALYWFNPLAWIVARTMAADREHAVDAMVLDGGARASSYAALLLRVAVRADASGILAPFHAPAVGRADLTRRIEAVLGSRPARATRLRRVACCAAIVTAALVVACSQAPLPAPSSQPSSSTSTAAAAATTAGENAPQSPVRSRTPSGALLEQALGGPTTLEATRQAAAEEMLDAWLAEDQNVIRAHAIAMELPSGRIVVAGGRDRATGATTGLERAYPPASTIKPLVLAAALEAGVVHEDETIDGHGGSRELTTPTDTKHAITDFAPQRSMSLAKMLAVSSNVGATTIGERLGTVRLASAFERAGLFVPVEGLVVGQPPVPTSDHEAWHASILSIGHDFSTNPLRMVAAYSAFASGGEVVSPRLRETTPHNTTPFVSAHTAQVVMRMMEGVVAEGGTGSLARVDDLRIAGKTGTADLSDDVFYTRFIGIFPAEAPRYVLLVGAETRSVNGPRSDTPRFAKLVRRAFR